MQQLNDLTNHPDTAKVMFAGKEWDFFICPYGMMKADDEGIDVIAEFDALYRNAGSPVKALRTISKIVWVGILPFHPNITLEQVQVNLSLTDVQTITPVLTAQMQRLTKGGADAGEAKAPTKRGAKK